MVRYTEEFKEQVVRKMMALKYPTPRSYLVDKHNAGSKQSAIKLPVDVSIIFGK